MKTLFVADPISKLKPQSDTSLAIARECFQRGWKVYWAIDSDLEFNGHEVLVHASTIRNWTSQGVPELEKVGTSPLSDFHSVWIRKDPPFDTEYVKLCWLLALEEPRVKMINRPSLLLRYHEKLLPLEAMSNGFLDKKDIIPTFLGSFSRAKEFIASHKMDPIVTKPFLGYGGNDIQKTSRSDFENSLKHSSDFEINDRLVQPYRDEIKTRGDRRVLYVNGDVIAHFARIPREGDFVSNLAQGGSARLEPFTADEERAAKKVGRFLKHVGIVFAGADLIGRYVSEVNITSPTGLLAYQKLTGENVAPKIVDAITNNTQWPS